MGSGRKLLSGAKRKAFLKAKARGATDALACSHAGFAQTTLYAWLRRGKSEPAGHYHDFYTGYQKATAHVCNVALGVVEHHLKRKDAKTAMWVLERFRPHDYSLQSARFAKEERERLEALGETTKEEAATKASTEAMLLEIATDMSPAASRELLDAIRRAKAKADES